MPRTLSVRWILPALVLVLCAAGVPPAKGGAWTRPEGGYFLKASWLEQGSGQRLDCGGETVLLGPPETEFLDRQLYLYLEYGWRPRWTLVGSWAIKEQRVRRDGFADFGTRSTGDLRLGLRRSFAEGSTAFSLESLLSVPTYPPAELDRPPAERSQSLPVGTGEFEAEMRLLGGRSLYPLPLYLNLDLGYRWRGGAFGDQWLGAVEVGGSAPRVFAKLELRWTVPVGDPCTGVGVGNVATEFRTVQLSPEIAIRLWGSWWAQVGAARTLSGRNVLAGTQWSVGLSVLGGA